MTKEDLNAKGSWLAVTLGFDLGARIGNVTRADGSNQEDHCIRTTDVTTEIYDLERPTFVVKGSEALRFEITSGHLDPKTVVKRAWLTLVSSKTMRSVKAQTVPKLLDRRSKAEGQLLDDLVE